MKKIYFLAFFMAFSCQIFASNPFEKESFETDFKRLNQIEAYIESHPDVDLEQLKSQNQDLVANIEFDKNISSNLIISDDLLDIPLFWYGFCAGVIGILLVYILTDKDKGLTNRAMRGCLSWVVLSACFYIVLAVTSSTY